MQIIKSQNIHWIIGLFAYGIIGLFPQQAHAQTTSLSVSPSIIRLDLQYDKPQAELTYTNTTNQTVEVALTAQDFRELEDGYKLSFLEGKDSANYKYSLSSWIDFNKKTLVIDPYASENVLVYINKDKLTPGGHYASILAQITSKNTTPGTIAVQATLSSLLFVRTNTGREIEAANIPSFGTAQDGIFFPFPQSAFFRLQNSGDVELIPYGMIQITDMFHHIVAKGIINTNSLSTLPESIRRYDITLEQQSFLIILPGMYNTTISLHAGKKPLRFTLSQTFFSQGTLPLIQIGLAISIAWGLFFFIRRKKTKI